MFAFAQKLSEPVAPGLFQPAPPQWGAVLALLAESLLAPVFEYDHAAHSFLADRQKLGVLYEGRATT